MHYPERWQRLPYGEWNRMVQGLMAVWDYAEMLGAEECLEWHLDIDADGRLAELLSGVGRGEVRPLSLKRLNEHGSEGDGNGHAGTHDEVNAYFQSTDRGTRPDRKAYDGGLVVREFLLRVEQFADERKMAPSDLRRLLCEAISIYAECDDTLRSFSPLTA